MDGAANVPLPSLRRDPRVASSPQTARSGVSSPERVLAQDESRCLSCGAPAEALLVERDGKVFQRVRCSTHGQTENLILSDSRLHHKLDEWNRRVFAAGSVLQDVDDEENKAPLLAVMDLTNRCNLRCPVCFADVTGDNSYFLELETVRGMLRALVERKGQPCRHIQFSGGEPTLHPHFLEILKISRDLGFDHIQVATNGLRFAHLDFARRCEEAGLHTLYLQFDGMTDEVYRVLRGQPLLDQKLRVYESIVRTNMRVVLVPTIVAGLNVDQLGPIFRFALEHSQHTTGISVQPMSVTGRVKVPHHGQTTFDLADMAREFGEQTGLTRMPDDWIPLNALTMLTRGVARLRGDSSQSPGCDAHCSVGTYFYIDEDNRPTCLTRFLDLERLLQEAGELKAPSGRARLLQKISALGQLKQLSSAFDSARAPRGLSFLRLLRGLEGWEDKNVGRARSWFRRGFNGMFVAGMHFMDSTNYSARRVRRCIIKYVTTDGQVLSFCRYNAGERYRDIEEAHRLAMCDQAGH
jgi:7,8-dihydro-6-hydroxymethylpterin dimethyltransferase